MTRRRRTSCLAALALALLLLAGAPVRALAGDVPCAAAPCELAFTTQPAVEAGSPITGAAGNPAGPPTAVSSLDPSGAATASRRSRDGVTSCENNVACSASAAVTGVVPGTGTSYTNSVKVSAAPNPDRAVPDDGGTLTVAYNIGPDFTCSGARLASPDREVIAGPNRVKTVRSKIARALLIAAGRQPSSLQTCLVAPYRFNLGRPFIGGTATPLGDIDGDGNPDYSGVLPTCDPVSFPIFGRTVLIGAPCQVSAVAEAAGNGIVTYRLPADPRDPAARH